MNYVYCYSSHARFIFKQVFDLRIFKSTYHTNSTINSELINSNTSARKNIIW